MYTIITTLLSPNPLQLHGDMAHQNRYKIIEHKFSLTGLALRQLAVQVDCIELKEDVYSDNIE